MGEAVLRLLPFCFALLTYSCACSMAKLRVVTS